MKIKVSLGSALAPIVIAAVIVVWLVPTAVAHPSLPGRLAGHPASTGPMGPYAPFADCPLNAPHVFDCLVGTVTGGQLTIGKNTVPIDHTLTLQGGLAREAEEETPTLVPAVGGATLSPTPIEVPGGLLGLLGAGGPHGPGVAQLPRGWRSLNTVTLTLEPVGTAHANLSNLINEEGPALTLPVRIRVGNALLGSACYIGSTVEPVALALTDSVTSPPPPNQPISGSAGALSIEQEGSIARLTEGTLVNNELAVPKANGCGPFGLLDGLIDRAIGLPSPSGENTAILDVNVVVAAAAAVRNNEE